MKTSTCDPWTNGENICQQSAPTEGNYFEDCFVDKETEQQNKLPDSEQYLQSLCKLTIINIRRVINISSRVTRYRLYLSPVYRQPHTPSSRFTIHEIIVQNFDHSKQIRNWKPYREELRKRIWSTLWRLSRKTASRDYWRTDTSPSPKKNPNSPLTLSFDTSLRIYRWVTLPALKRFFEAEC